RAPALPAFGLGCGGGGDVHGLRAQPQPAGVARHRLVALEGPRLAARRHVAAHNLALCPGRLVDGLGHVQRLREPAAVQPRDAVAYLEPGVLDGARETVPGAGATEREQVATRFEDAQALGGPLLAPLP